MEAQGTEREARAEFFGAAGGYAEVVSVEAGGVRYLVSTRDQNIGRLLFVRRSRMEMRLLDRALRSLAGLGQPLPKGTTLVDVGANIGTTTFSGLANNGFGQAVAIEPEPLNAALFRATAALNNLTSRVLLVEAAASSQPGSMKLRVSERNLGGHRLVAKANLFDESLINVRVVTLDQLVEDGTIVPEQVGLVWLDVQYHEAQVITGATSLTATGVPLVAEVTSKTSDAIWGVATQVGYTHAQPLAHEGDLISLTNTHALADAFGTGHPTDALIVRL